jgi:hypothetical protein
VPATGSPEVFVFDSLNRRYEQLATDLAPIELGAFTIYLDSPQHQLTLLANRLELTPLGDGRYDFSLELRFAGEGQLTADLDIAGARSHYADHLVVPEQSRTLAGRARVMRDAEGYLVVPEALPPSFDVAIHSQVGQQLLLACRGLAALMPVDCNLLQRGFSEVSIPLPDSGDTYIVAAQQLSEAERQRLDAYLLRFSGAAGE